MKKKRLITLLIGILVIGTIVAGIGVLTKEKEIPTEDYNKLASVDSIKITSTDIECNEDYCDVVYISTGYGHTSYCPDPYWENCKEYPKDVFRGECLTLEKIYYTNEELEEQKDAKIEDLKDRIIKRLKLNEERDKEKDLKVPESIIEYKKPKKEKT